MSSVSRYVWVGAGWLHNGTLSGLRSLLSQGGLPGFLPALPRTLCPCTGCCQYPSSQRGATCGLWGVSGGPSPS